MLGRYRSRQQCAAVVMGAAGTDAAGAHLPSTADEPAAPELEQELQPPHAESQPQLQLEPMPEAIELNVVHSAKAVVAAAAAAQMVLLQQRAEMAVVEARIASTRRWQRVEEYSAAVRMASEHHQVPTTFLHH